MEAFEIIANTAFGVVIMPLAEWLKAKLEITQPLVKFLLVTVLAIGVGFGLNAIYGYGLDSVMIIRTMCNIAFGAVATKVTVKQVKK